MFDILILLSVFYIPFYIASRTVGFVALFGMRMDGSLRQYPSTSIAPLLIISFVPLGLELLICLYIVFGVDNDPLSTIKPG